MSLRGRKFGNDTLDVANKGCFDTFDTLACVRSSLLTGLAACTLACVIFKLVKYHAHRHPQLHHYVIFYVSALECLVCAASFMASHAYPQLAFSASFLKLQQLACVCHLHWTMAARAWRRDDLVQHCVHPLICLFALYCTAVALMGMVDVAPSWTECFRPYWLMLSCADLVLVQLFAGAAAYVSHRRASLGSLLLSFRSADARALWTVLAAFEFSALLSVGFDTAMRFVGEERDGCSGIFAHTQLFYSTTLAVVTVGKFFVPTWALLCVFEPSEPGSSASEVALASRLHLEPSSDSGCSTIRGYHEYQRFPLGNGHVIGDGTVVLDSGLISPYPHTLISDFSNPISPNGFHSTPHLGPSDGDVGLVAGPIIPGNLGIAGSASLHSKLSTLTVAALSTISEESAAPSSHLDSPIC